MSVVPLAQFTGETRVLTDLAYYADPVALSTVQAKTGTRSYRLSLGTGPFGKALAASKSAVRIGYWLYLDGDIEPEALIYQAGDGLGFSSATSLLAVDVNPLSGLMRVRRNDATAGDAPEILASVVLPAAFSTVQTFFHVGVTHLVHASTGFLSVYINKVSVLNYIGDTRPSFDNGASAAYQTTVSRVLGPGGVGAAQGFTDAFVDDLYIDAIESEADAVVPARQFIFASPTGAGADDEWTPSPGANWQNVDDNPNDGDTTTNRTTAADQRDTLDMGDVTLPDNYHITAVLPTLFLRRALISDDALISLHAFDGLDYLDSDDMEVPTDYNSPVFARFETQPDASDWDETSFNAMQMGYRSRSTA